MITVLIGIIVFGIAVTLLSVGLIFSKKTRLKKSCSGGLGPHRVDSEGKHVPCGTCSCRSLNEL